MCLNSDNPETPDGSDEARGRRTIFTKKNETHPSQLLEAMTRLHLGGMRKACDEIMSATLKRGHGPQRLLGDLLAAEISEKKARSIKHQMTIAKLPLAKELEEVDFGAAEVDEAPVRSLASGDALDRQRNAVLVGGTGKTHLAVGLAPAWIRDGWPTRPPDWTS